MHTNKPKKQWDERTLSQEPKMRERDEKCCFGVVSILFQGHFRYAAPFHFSLSFQRSKKLLIAVNALLIRIYSAVWTQKHSLRTGLCFILNFKLEMELLRRKMRHDLDSKRIKCEMIFFSVSLFLFFLSTLNNNPEHNFTLIYTFPIAPHETRCCRSFLFWSSSNSFLIS